MGGEPVFTVLAPVHRPPDLLPFAVRSVLDQSRQDFELFIVCDGAPDATVEAARGFEAQDPRVRAFVHPKGERHGEAYRHLALQAARGRIVCQIGDDDLWFPDHLAEAEALMATADFGATLPLFFEGPGGPVLHFGDLGDPAVRRRMSETPYNLFGPTTAAYRLETYRRLPVGWAPAPEGIWTDLWMWRKFLALPGVRCATRFRATTLSFPATVRREWPLWRRAEEIAAHAAAIQSPDYRDRLFREGLAEAARRLTRLQTQGVEMRAVGRALLAALEQVEGALETIAAAGDAQVQAQAAKAALAGLPDRAWRDRLKGPPAAG